MSVSAIASAQADTPAQTEQMQAFRLIGQQASRCRGDQECFRAHVRPFGPWIVAVGGRQGQADPVLASQVTNFAFGVAGGQAGIDPAAINRAFFCGERCMKARMADLSRKQVTLRIVAREFIDTGVLLVALWPDGKVRVNDCVIDRTDVRCIRRTSELGLFQGWTTGDPAPRDVVPVERALSIASSLRANGLVAIVQDEGGGVRLLHRDSLAENEVGLLFADAPPELGQAFSDGSSYAVADQVASGVFAYLRV